MAVDLASLIIDVPDYPRPGIGFKDITPLLASPTGLAAAVTGLVESVTVEVDVVVGLEARGFLFGPPVALALGLGFVPVRKPGKLPRATINVMFDLEYGSDTLCMHSDALRPGQRVLIVDDVLATGGTVAATVELVRLLGGTVAGVAVVVELGYLGGRARLTELGLDVRSQVRFEKP